MSILRKPLLGEFACCAELVIIIQMLSTASSLNKIRPFIL